MANIKYAVQATIFVFLTMVEACFMFTTFIVRLKNDKIIKILKFMGTKN